ncbi:MAG: hypothetical protein RL662_2363 [Bacteroidota bacterium]|jgi:hypothetical protein
MDNKELALKDRNHMIIAMSGDKGYGYLNKLTDAELHREYCLYIGCEITPDMYKDFFVMLCEITIEKMKLIDKMTPVDQRLDGWWVEMIRLGREMHELKERFKG